jgi:medium-chain acyl-[acyl-carrier-protein] hydrolase
MEQNAHRRDFRLRYSEVDDRGELTPVSLLNILEETASSHCDESGWGVFRLMREGYGWVLLRGGFEMARYPRYREDFGVETWISKSRRFEAYRENRIVSSTGETLGTARALWLFYDIAKRRPASIFEDILKAWTPGGQAASAMDLSEVNGPTPSPVAESRKADPDFAVRKADIDTNGHVNNVVYLSWALEALPKATREGSYLSSLRGQFKRELRLGANAMPLCADEGDGRFRLGVIASPGSLATDPAEPYMAAAAESLWRPRLSA